MVRMTQQQNQDEFKSQLTIQICNIARRSSVGCTHHRPNDTRITSSFIDWYLVLQVKEDASIDAIRKQYRKLALLLHPDKNKHPKAEIAFKLVSQAYTCLSDQAKRNAFNLDRWRSLCGDCSKVHNTSDSSNPTTYDGERRIKASSDPSTHRSYRILQHLKDIREKMAEEARVIESCLRVNSQGGRRNEYPVFNPSNYLHQGYPHTRYYKPLQKRESFEYMQRGNLPNYNQRGRCETPVFELRTKCTPVNVESACLSS